ncbi:transcriptional regulator [Pseudomonas amygdali pv. tabaci str. ATCC 11528]|uniref:DNA binding protein n=1 Tax=Pseudomonas fluorescens TaxID=294 RepID=A0AAE2U2S9_PSEFL|nr:transcriptional regulator [Pseudomonas amygdali pv. tabaci str. ATCC 11528]KKY52928.1 transcriptional regulator [Pseudomonas amygdali pv. tabaci str. ATCC 11528]MBD8269330.1 DNA binding protein [Pseudomonas fluorescens]QED85935.1 transcriptional regulator [Pseudomonas amygdali pv. tabaci str. ATCC 11528]ROM95241.1 transcriptional regulator [Pseudomonas brassicacearum]
MLNSVNSSSNSLPSLQNLKHSKAASEMQAEIQFETKLRDLLADYGYSLRDIINILDPQANRRSAAPAVAEKAPRRARQIKQYKNPHNGEIIETKGGNHKLLKEWKAQYGTDEVESWLTR